MSKQWTKTGLAALVAVALAGCASHNTRSVPDSGVGRYVDGTVDPTISSIDRSLQTLVMLERGDEAPRKPGAIGDTVAGAGGKKTPAVAVSKSLPAGSAAAEARQQSQMDYNRAALKSTVRLDWQGRADGLLAQVGEAIHYRVDVPDSLRARLPQVKVKADAITIEEVLSQVARQVEGVANLRVETADRVIRVLPAR